MKNIERVARRFNTLYADAGIHATVDTLESFDGYYKIYVDDNGFTTMYAFVDAKDFADWAFNVVFD